MFNWKTAARTASDAQKKAAVPMAQSNFSNPMYAEANMPIGFFVLYYSAFNTLMSLIKS